MADGGESPAGTTGSLLFDLGHGDNLSPIVGSWYFVSIHFGVEEPVENRANFVLSKGHSLNVLESVLVFFLKLGMRQI